MIFLRYSKISLTIILFSSFVLSNLSFALQWPINSADDPLNYNTVNCTFGEIHPTNGDHFHGAIDIDCTNNPAPPARAVEPGVIPPDGIGSISVTVEHGAQKKTRYLHITPNANLQPGDTIDTGDSLGTVNGHLHFEMWYQDGGTWYRVNPLVNDAGWALEGPLDNADPEINDVILEPINQPAGVASGYEIKATAGALTNYTDGTIKIHLRNRPGSSGTTYDSVNDTLVIYGSIAPIVSARDVDINGGDNGNGLTVQTIDYSVEDTPKYNIEFDRIRNSDLYEVNQVFHTIFNNSSDNLYGNNDFIELRSLDSVYLYPHKTINSIQSNGVWFTKAHENTNEIFETTPTNTAQVNKDAKYKDGEYTLTFRVTDASDRDDTQSIKVIVDNFRPYVHRVTIIQEGKEKYDAYWDWNGTELVLTPATKKGRNPIAFSDGEFGLVRIEFSEPVQNPIVWSCNSEYPFPSFSPIDDENKIWQGWAPFYNCNCFRIEWELRIYATDLAGNGLLSLSDKDTTIDPTTQLTRDTSGNMQGTGGTDEVHCFSFRRGKGVTLLIDESASMDGDYWNNWDYPFPDKATDPLCLRRKGAWNVACSLEDGTDMVRMFKFNKVAYFGDCGYPSTFKNNIDWGLTESLTPGTCIARALSSARSSARYTERIPITIVYTDGLEGDCGKTYGCGSQSPCPPFEESQSQVIRSCKGRVYYVRINTPRAGGVAKIAEVAEVADEDLIAAVRDTGGEYFEVNSEKDFLLANEFIINDINDIDNEYGFGIIKIVEASVTNNEMVVFTTIDSTISYGRFYLEYNGEINMELYDPNGTRREITSDTTLATAWYQIVTPEIGDWKAVIRGEGSFTFMVSANTSITFELVSSELWLEEPSPISIRLEGEVSDLSFYLIRLDGTVFDTISLGESETPGIYKGVYTPLSLGEYRIRVEGKDARGEDFVRETTSTIITMKPGMQPGFPVKTNGGVSSSPALGDINGDGRLEIVVGSNDNKVYAWNDEGSLVTGFPVGTGGAVGSSPALGDIDGDGRLEIVVGSNDNKVYAWNDEGSLVPGFPVDTGWIINSSPALGDIDGDGRLEIVVGSNNNKVYAWNDDGSLVPGFPVDTGWIINSSPALGDIDGDGRLEIVVGSDGDRVYAWNDDGSLVPGFPVGAGGAVGSSLALGDIDRDGRLEIVVGSYDNKVYAWNDEGSLVPGFPVDTRGAVNSSPALGDIDQDGRLEIVVGSDDGYVYCWQMESNSYNPDLLPWPMFHHDMRRTGLIDNKYDFVKIVEASVTNDEMVVFTTIDSTISHAYFYLEYKGEINIELYDPKGTKREMTSDTTLARASYQMVAPEIGDWKAVITGKGSFTFMVSANTSVTFELVSLELLWLEQLSPISIRLEGEVSDLSFYLIRLDGTVLDTLSLEESETPGIYEGVYTPLSLGEYRVRVEGKDARGEDFVRETISTIAVKSVGMQPGFPVKADVYYYVMSSPALGDIDQNDEGRLEIVVGSRSRKVYVWNDNGTPVDGFPVSTGGMVDVSPALGDIDGDGRLEIVVGSGDNKLYAWNNDGTLVNGFPVISGGGGQELFMDACPVLGDIDQNDEGRLEIVTGSADGKVYAWNDNGTPVDGFPVSTGENVRVPVPPALGDIDDDGRLEIVVSSSDGKIYAWNDDGIPVKGFPVGRMDRIYSSSPALGDIDGDGRLEIVIGSYYNKLYAWNDDGSLVPGFPVSTGEKIDSSPALGDIDGDGRLEIVVGSYDKKLYAWNDDGILVPGFPVSTGGSIYSSPALGDIDRDGRLEIVIGSCDKKVYAWNDDGNLVPGFPVSTGGDVWSSPALGDIDQDGRLEIVVGSNDYHVYCWQMGPNSYNPDLLPWPMFHHDMMRTGLYPLTGPQDVTPPGQIVDLAAGSPATDSLTLTWMAPGDDGDSGTAAAYNIRYSTSSITEANWAVATQVSGEPTPQVAGTVQSLTVGGLASGTTYYFRMTASDEVPNTSPLSNEA
ncbi:MAG: FG-GAP-like repeat-containing protein, partial [bacterium]